VDLTGGSDSDEPGSPGAAGWAAAAAAAAAESTVAPKKQQRARKRARSCVDMEAPGVDVIVIDDDSMWDD
jgi:hypothetical protein